MAGNLKVKTKNKLWFTRRRRRQITLSSLRMRNKKIKKKNNNKPLFFFFHRPDGMEKWKSSFRGTVDWSIQPCGASSPLLLLINKPKNFDLKKKRWLHSNKTQIDTRRVRDRSNRFRGRALQNSQVATYVNSTCSITIESEWWRVYKNFCDFS